MEQRQSSRSARHWSETCYSLGALEGKALGTEMQRAAISVLHKSANFYLGTEMSSNGHGRGNERRLSSHLQTGQDDPRQCPPGSSNLASGWLSEHTNGSRPQPSLPPAVQGLCSSWSSVPALLWLGRNRVKNLTLPLMPISRGGLPVNCPQPLAPEQN